MARTRGPLVLVALLHLLLLPASASAQNVIWALEDTSSFFLSPAIGGDGTIYVCSEEGNLHAISARGARKWTFETGGEITSSPAVGADGTIYLAAGGSLYAVSAEGTQRWTFRGREAVYPSAAIGRDGTIYVGSPAGMLYAVSADGTEKWSFQARDAVSSPAVGEDGTIYVVAGGKLYAVSPDGKPGWTYGTTLYTTPAIGADGTIYVGSSDGYLYAIWPEGRRKWVFETGTTVYDSPAIGADGTIYVASSDGGRLFAVSAEGRERWTYGAGQNFTTPAIGADGTVFAGSHRGSSFHALDSSGRDLWSFDIGVGGSPTIGADGTIYVGSGDKLYALRSDCGGLARSSWPMYRRDPSHSAAAGSVGSGSAQPPRQTAPPLGFVFVEGGTFQMGDTAGGGSENEKPLHSVTVSSFYLGEYEVTQKEWLSVMGSNPSFTAGEDQPVEQVSWFDVIDFCNRLSAREGLQPCYTIRGAIVGCDFSKDGYRLPTEAEWEYAARGGKLSRGTRYAGGNDYGAVGWVRENSNRAIHPVGGKEANELGLYDMCGNADEWCWDWFGSYGSRGAKDPKGPFSGTSRVLRGGSWVGTASRAGCASRYEQAPDDPDVSFGFRLARSAGQGR